MFYQHDQAVVSMLKQLLRESKERTVPIIQIGLLLSNVTMIDHSADFVSRVSGFMMPAFAFELGYC